MVQQGQVFKLDSKGVDARALWAYLYRTGGRGSKRMQRGGFAREDDARAALDLVAARAVGAEGRHPLGREHAELRPLVRRALEGALVTATITTAGTLYRAAREHLRGHVEQVGFFLAKFDADHRAFVLREWRPMPPEAFEYQSAYHVTLRDGMRPEIIKWAWNDDGCLVEVHSHGDDGIASFSPSDLYGFDEWVPHVRWRLRGRPYAAIVTAGDSFDALAWLDGENGPIQVATLEVDGVTHMATARTLQRLAELRERHD